MEKEDNKEPRKTKINLIKNYPPEYLKRLEERLAREAEQERKCVPEVSVEPENKPEPTKSQSLPTSLTGKQPTSSAGTSSAGTSSAGSSSTGTSSSGTSSSGSSSSGSSSTGTSSAGTSSNSNNTTKGNNSGVASNSKIKIHLAIAGSFLLAIVAIAIATAMTINREYEQRVKTYGNYCTQDNIWAILDHVDRESRILDAKGMAILDSLKRLFPNDYWLHFIDEMNNRIKNGEHQDSLQFMKRISVAKPVNKKAPEYVKYDDIYFSLRIRGYLGDDDIVEKNGRLFVERGKGERAVKQFKKDSGLPMDADLDTKEASELLRIWQSDWSTRYLGVRKIWTMRMEPGTDSDELILSLVNAGFCRTKPKLCLIKGRHDHPIISKYILAAGKAGCETLTSPYLRRHYRVPDDLETCYRAFQAYHGLTPDGELDEKGISLLRTYR